MDRILIAEDEKRLREIVEDYFSAHGFACDQAADGSAALELLRQNDYDAVLLDIMMPGPDGFSVCREARKKSGVPILFMTALGGEEDILHGYALGADDYIVKPFSLAVLLAKTKSIILRSRGQVGAKCLACGEIFLDEMKRLCVAEGKQVRLTTGEFDLLLCLMRNRGQVLSREQLLDKVWGLDFDGDDRAVDVRVRSLRAALGEAGKQIRTVYKAGYRLEG